MNRTEEMIQQEIEDLENLIQGEKNDVFIWGDMKYRINGLGCSIVLVAENRKEPVSGMPAVISKVSH